MGAQPSNGIQWTDSHGRNFLVQLASGDSDPAHGYIIGPPLELWEALEDLPEEIRLKLWNELYYRELYTSEDVRLRAGDVEGALKAALNIYGRRVTEAYNGRSHEADR